MIVTKRSLFEHSFRTGHVAVMMALGNSVTNSIFESNLKGRVKPNASSSREEKERWIQNKYKKKEFLSILDYSHNLEEQLIDAVSVCDVPSVANILAHVSSSDQINQRFASFEYKTSLHLAAGKGNLAIVQLLIWVI